MVERLKESKNQNLESFGKNYWIFFRMNLDKVLQIANRCIEDEIIQNEDLSITYKLDEELFYRKNNDLSDFTHNEIIEIKIAGITFIFMIK